MTRSRARTEIRRRFNRRSKDEPRTTRVVFHAFAQWTAHLDELLRATPETRMELLDLEELDEQELDAIRAEYEGLAERARAAQRKSRVRPQQPTVSDSET